MEGQQFDKHRAEVQLNDIEARWRNLNQTVPPHAQDWWDRNMGPQKQRILELKEKIQSSDDDLTGVSEEIQSEIAELEELCEDAGERLGARTAAGRAKPI